MLRFFGLKADDKDGSHQAVVIILIAHSVVSFFIAGGVHWMFKEFDEELWQSHWPNSISWALFVIPLVVMLVYRKRMI